MSEPTVEKPEPTRGEKVREGIFVAICVLVAAMCIGGLALVLPDNTPTPDLVRIIPHLR